MAKVRYIGATKELYIPQGSIDFLEHGKIYDMDTAGVAERRLFSNRKLFVLIEEPAPVVVTAQPEETAIVPEKKTVFKRKTEEVES